MFAQVDSNIAAICFGAYTLFFAAYTFAHRTPASAVGASGAIFGYLPAAYLPLTVISALDFFKADLWLPAITGLAVLYFIFSIATRAKKDWSAMYRNSALILGTILSFAALLLEKETAGWGFEDSQDSQTK